MLLLTTAYNFLNSFESNYVKNGDIDIDDHCLGIQSNCLVYFKMIEPNVYIRKNIAYISNGHIVDDSLDFTTGCTETRLNMVLLHKTKDLNEIIEITKKLHFLCNSYRNFQIINYNDKKAQVKIGKNYLKFTVNTNMFRMIKRTNLLQVLECLKDITGLSNFIIKTEKNKHQYLQINLFLYSLLADKIEIVNV